MEDLIGNERPLNRILSKKQLGAARNLCCALFLSILVLRQYVLVDTSENDLKIRDLPPSGNLFRQAHIPGESQDADFEDNESEGRLRISRRLLEAASTTTDAYDQVDEERKIQLNKEKQRLLVETSAENWRKQQKAGIKADMMFMPGPVEVEVPRVNASGVESVKLPIPNAVNLGPAVPDWDEQREDFIKKHPGSNVSRLGQPRVMLLTGSQPSVCGNDVGDFLFLKALKNKNDYCDPRDIHIFYSMSQILKAMESFWVKLPLIRKMMLSHPEVEWFWWMDSDAIITDMTFEIPFERYKNHNFVLHGWEKSVYQERDWVGLNTGSMFVRNCKWSLDLLDAWSQHGWKRQRMEYGRLYHRDLKGRPLFESDDQSALVWMLVYNPGEWASKVYLESVYFLHGYWQILTKNYDDMMLNSHPGYGDHRWPFVTHFVGCKPCAKLGTLNMDETKDCIENMERAFNFADNQVIRKFGFEHLHLDTPQVVKINVTSYKASEFDSALKKRQIGR